MAESADFRGCSHSTGRGGPGLVERVCRRIVEACDTDDRYNALGGCVWRENHAAGGDATVSTVISRRGGGAKIVGGVLMAVALLWLAWLLCATHAAQVERQRAHEASRRGPTMPQTSGCLVLIRTDNVVRRW